MLMGVYIQHHWRALYIFTTQCFFVSMSSTRFHFLLQSSFKFHRFVRADNHAVRYSMTIASDNFKTQTTEQRRQITMRWAFANYWPS